MSNCGSCDLVGTYECPSHGRPSPGTLLRLGLRFNPTDRAELLSALLRGMARRSVQRGRMLEDTCRAEHQSRVMARRYRAALEEIAGYGCEFPSAACTDKYVDPDADFDEFPCPPCVARAELEAPDA